MRPEGVFRHAGRILLHFEELERLARSVIHTSKEGAKLALAQAVVAPRHGLKDLGRAGSHFVQSGKTTEGLAQDPARRRHATLQDLTLTLFRLQLLHNA
ncbi:hypothetical protein APX01_21680 (plasmid) [Cereibacter sphaeroides]|nr:hypothetical protein APX01_21680 [Cereibacter sphaeroides]